MLAQRCVTGGRTIPTQGYAFLLLSLSGLLISAPLLEAQTKLGPVSVGAGLRTSFMHTDPDGATSTDRFLVENARIYVNGSVTEDIKFMFNTDYDSVTNDIKLLDAAARLEFSPKFNIWAGRFLPPSDRANLYGPFYAHNWLVYTDGVQDGYPFVYQGRQNGVVYWVDFAKKVKVSVGAFDGQSANGVQKVIGAARVQIDFWDPEEGYYLNGTYYGEKNLLAIGGAAQVQSGNNAASVDFLLERKVLNGGAFSIESEYANYNRLGGYDANYGNSQGAYILGSFLFPKQVGVGKFEVLGKFAKANFTHGPRADYSQKTTEVNFSYIIKQFDARATAFFKDARFNREKANSWIAGIGLQIQM